MKTKFNPMDADYQRAVADFVGREVHYCASYLISELAKDEKHMDDLYPILSQEDYEQGARDHINARDSRDELLSLAEYYGDQDLDDLKKLNDDELKEAIYTALNSSHWQDYCEGEQIDPYTNEALEHWIVSDWLADRLADKGEMIEKDFLGLTIWGRTTSGQAISMDYVIQSIYNDLQGG